MKVLRSSKYRLVDIEKGNFVFKNVVFSEYISVPQAKYIDETTGNVVILKKVQDKMVAELSYSTLRRLHLEFQDEGLLNSLLAQA